MITIEINPDGIDPGEYAGYYVRSAARGIVLNAAGQLGVMFVSKRGYHKLPGGGIEAREDAQAAARRECQEELGCDVQIEAEFARTLEVSRERRLAQHSVYFLAKVSGERAQSLTNQEHADGFCVEWLELAHAWQRFEEDQPESLVGWYIHLRDSLVLQAYLQTLKRITSE